ncbi:MAG TPA: methyltransferase domain-containing protein [Candidatus Paceibacterota bacterium]|nr:methyltransferase domain-containing protein [Candidatus Paceibacterota bacterium]
MDNKVMTVTSTSIAHNGAARCDVGGMTVFVHGMLPGETAVVDTMRKHGVLLGDIKEFISISPARKAPEELHYLSCSPWQVIQYPTQAALKHEIITDLYGYYDDAPKPSFTPAEQYYGYRTKAEFSFTDRDGVGGDLPLALAYHIRNAGKARTALPSGCELLSENMNSVALALCAKLRDLGLTAFELKALTVRESKSNKICIATLYAKEKTIPEFSIDTIPNLAGIEVWYSTHKSPAAVQTELLWEKGIHTLTEDIDGIELTYPSDGFFQNNIPVFKKAVERMREFLPKDKTLLELYSGVGTIGLLLAKDAKSVHGVEINPSSVALAAANAAQNNISNYTAQCLPAEKINKELIEDFEVLLLDPPRVGLHPKLINSIKAAAPETIIYLSCNPETQARDYADMKDMYSIVHIEGFDFYPQTPHCESLLVLKKR